MRVHRLLAGVIGLSEVLVAVLLLLPSAPAPPTPGSYRASVLRVLSAHNLEARDVVVVDSCAPTVERCRTYSGAVTVVAQTRLRGRIDCRERWTTCTLAVTELRIREPLPDVIDPLAWRAQQLWAAVMAWLRQVGRHQP